MFEPGHCRVRISVPSAKNHLFLFDFSRFSNENPIQHFPKMGPWKIALKFLVGFSDFF